MKLFQKNKANKIEKLIKAQQKQEIILNQINKKVGIIK